MFKLRVRTKQRILSCLLICLFVFVFVTFFVHFEVEEVEATITGSTPPASGDWVITTDTVVEDETLTINGSIVVESDADLTIRRSTIYVKGNITRKPNGGLLIENSTITTEAVSYTHLTLPTN